MQIMFGRFQLMSDSLEEVFPITDDFNRRQGTCLYERAPSFPTAFSCPSSAAAETTSAIHTPGPQDPEWCELFHVLAILTGKPL